MITTKSMTMPVILRLAPNRKARNSHHQESTSRRSSSRYLICPLVISTYQPLWRCLRRKYLHYHQTRKPNSKTHLLSRTRRSLLGNNRPHHQWTRTSNKPSQPRNSQRRKANLNRECFCGNHRNRLHWNLRTTSRSWQLSWNMQPSHWRQWNVV